MFNFINPLMIIGLLGISLPILAHLLSKRKYDVVDWGAMQFLELGQNARRKILLEQILLLLLRIGLISLLVLAFMRPWAEGSWTKAVSTENRDVVIVIDGSYSMGWEGQSVTPHNAALRFADHLIDDLKPGDTVAVIDAREQARVLIESPTRDHALARETLNDIPPPAGTVNLAEAMRKAAQILSRTSNLAREIVVLTDGQSKGWRAADGGLWVQFDDLLEQPSVRPRTWVIEVGSASASERVNFSVEKLQLNREVTAVGYPVRIKTKIRSFGAKQPRTRKVYLEVNGQRLKQKTLQKTIKPGGEASVEFEYQFSSAGSHRVSVVLERDSLPGDNRADAAVTVTEAVPVLLVDGDPHPIDVIKSETVFAHSALTPEDNPAPWVKAEVVSWEKLTPRLKDLTNYEAVYLANIPRLTDAQMAALTEYVANGGGVFLALGDKIERTHYNSKLFAKGAGLLPAEIQTLKENKDESKQTVQVVSKSLEVPWIQRFRAEHDGGFCDVRFSHRWTTKPAKAAKAELPVKKSSGKADVAMKDGKTTSNTRSVSFSDAVVAARLNTGDPLIITRKIGRGGVVLMTSAIDGDWSTLPAKDDYTPLLHEIAFFLASSKTSRNVATGTPLVLEVDEKQDLDGYVFFGPGDTTFDFTSGGIVNNKRIVRLDDTSLPGVYVFRRKDPRSKPGEIKQDVRTPAEYFVVNFDRSESDLTPLSDDQRKALIAADEDASEAETRMTFLKTREELMEEMTKDNSRAEFWWILLLVFLGILIFEVAMARKMVQGGHVAVEAEAGKAAPPSESPSSHQGAPPPLPSDGNSRRPVVSGSEEDFWEPRGQSSPA